MEDSKVTNIATGNGIVLFVGSIEKHHNRANNFEVIAFKTEPVFSPELVREMRRRPRECA